MPSRNQYAFVLLFVMITPVTKCSSNTRATSQNHPAIKSIDSASAVALAIEAYKVDARSLAVNVGVAKFVEDSDGTLITLAPLDERTRGGVRLIRVTRDGRATVLQSTQ